MKVPHHELNEFTEPQQILNLVLWMLQGMAMTGASNGNAKLIAAYEAVLGVFNDEG